MANDKLNNDKSGAPFFRVAYPVEPYRDDFDCDAKNFPSLTVQADAESCDINNILATYDRTGVINHLSHRQPLFADFTDFPDYQTALNIVIEAENSFADLPSSLRSRFDNDPGKFVEFCSDPENSDALVEMGLAERVIPASPSGAQHAGDGEGVDNPLASQNAALQAEIAALRAGKTE